MQQLCQADVVPDLTPKGAKSYKPAHKGSPRCATRCPNNGNENGGDTPRRLPGIDLCAAGWIPAPYGFHHASSVLVNAFTRPGSFAARSSFSDGSRLMRYNSGLPPLTFGSCGMISFHSPSMTQRY